MNETEKVREREEGGRENEREKVRESQFHI